MRAVAAGVTDVGKERSHNEDRFVLLPEFDVYVVADGMGGHQCGEVASRMATSSIASFFRGAAASTMEGGTGAVLRASVEEANRRIHQRAASSPAHRGMGTTVVAAAVRPSEQKLYVVHAGDSRCYRLRDDGLRQLTRDHSLLEEALRTRPDITKAELSFLPANVITRALGVEASVDPDVTVDDAQVGDVYLLCSDGLHGFVGDERIREILVSRSVLTEACSDLVAEANKNGGGDNITAVLIRIEPQGERWSRKTSVPPSHASRSAHPQGSVDVAVPPAGRVPDVAMDASDSDEEEDLTPPSRRVHRGPADGDTPLTDLRIGPAIPAVGDAAGVTQPVGPSDAPDDLDDDLTPPPSV